MRELLLHDTPDHLPGSFNGRCDCNAAGDARAVRLHEDDLLLRDPMRHERTLPRVSLVNPWTLQTWFGHKRIDETMRCVHVASAHRRDLPECVQLAAQGIGDPDRRVLAMLGARDSYVAAAASEKKEVRESA